MIQLLNLTIANDRSKPLIQNQSLTISDGSLTALIGRNGSGKSTLIRTIAGMQKPLHGQIIINSINISDAKPRELCRLITIVTTDSPRVENLTCRQLVAYGRAPYTGLLGRLSDADREIVDQSLQAVDMLGFADRKVTRISDGERRRIMLARALAQQTPVILLDEPTSFLDVVGRLEISALLARLAHEQGKTIIYSTHELEPAFRQADTVLLISPEGLHPVREPFSF